MITRRNFLKLAAGSATVMAAPTVIAKPDTTHERILRFHNLHTGEDLAATYWVNGSYIADELTAINYVLRDHRSNEVAPIDRRLLDLLYDLQQLVNKPGRYRVISGYRSPETNAKLRRTTNGVAKRSMHMQGKAIDIRLAGVPLKNLRRAALKLHRGGVGYYPASNFIHVDTGRPRQW